MFTRTSITIQVIAVTTFGLASLLLAFHATAGEAGSQQRVWTSTTYGMPLLAMSEAQREAQRLGSSNAPLSTQRPPEPTHYHQRDSVHMWHTDREHRQEMRRDNPRSRDGYRSHHKRKSRYRH